MGESRKFDQVSRTELQRNKHTQKDIKHGRKSQNKIVEITQYASIKINENKRTTKCHEKKLKEAENAVDTCMHMC